MKHILFFTLILVSTLNSGSFAQPTVILQPYLTGFSSPVDIVNCNDSRLFVVEQSGIIKVINGGITLGTPFLNIDPIVLSGGEQGLLGLAFHPDYKNNGYFYVYFTNNAGNLAISRFSVSVADSNVANPNSEFNIITVPHPTNSNHNGGCLRFGPEGYLYIATGDGGGGGDTPNNAQSLNKLLGKMIRLDVDNGSPYKVPVDNPFINTTNAAPEIWAVGLRNPWRWSFDRMTGDLWIGDVGQGSWEEIDYTAYGRPGGVNYGWRCYEGNHPFNTVGCLPVSNYEPAAYELPNGPYASVVGGYVYRGGKYNDFFGSYFFSDFYVDTIHVLQKDSSGGFTHYSTEDLPGASFSCFGEDYLGELHVANMSTGIIYKIVSTVCTPVAFLSDKDTLEVCADSIELSTPAADSLFYSWQTPTGSGNSNSYWATQEGWYQVTTLNFSACTNTDSVYIILKGTPAPASFIGLDSIYCSNLDSADTLIGTPPGGIFTGAGIVGDMFYPDSAGNGTYQIQYQFTDSNGCASVATQVVFLSTCVGIEQSHSQDFIISGANPARGQLRFNLESRLKGMAEQSITDLSGRIIYKGSVLLEGMQQIELPMKNVETGIYFWTLRQGNSSVVYRFAWVD